MDTYKTGELFVYTNGDKWELGQVKRENNTGDGYFCYYSTGDTAASTPLRCMHKLANAGWSHIEGQQTCYRVPDSGHEAYHCSECGAGLDDGFSYCPGCGRKIVA